MTHCDGLYAAAVASRERYCSIGIDAEPYEALPEGVLRIVASPEEQLMLAENDLENVHLDRVMFSAKESIFKAWFPLTGRWLDFLDAELVLMPHGRFTARLLVDIPAAGYRTRLSSLHGRYRVGSTHVVTAVAVPA